MDWLDDKESFDIDYFLLCDVREYAKLRIGSFYIELFCEEGQLGALVACTQPVLSCLWNVTLKLAMSAVMGEDTNQLDHSSTFNISYKNQTETIMLWSLEELNTYDGINIKGSLQVLESHGLPFSGIEKFINLFKNSVDCTFLVDDEKVAVNKQFLSLYSPYFDTLFNGQFKETDQNEIEIKDVSYNEFITLLEVLLGISTVDVKNYDYLLKLSDRFQVETIKSKCESFIIEKLEDVDEYKFISNITALEYAEKYNLASLQKYAILSIKSVSELKILSQNSVFANELSDNCRIFVLTQVLKRTVDTNPE